MNDTHSQQIIHDFLERKGWNADKNLDQTAITQALCWVNEKVDHDISNLVAIGSSNIDTRKDQEKAREVLFCFLEKAIDFEESPPKFLIDSAPTLKTQIFDSLTVCTGETQEFYKSDLNLGIKEKYIQGTLSKTHWLTDLDIQRILEVYSLRGNIKVLPFNALDLRSTIGLTVVKDHVEAKEPYIIPLMLNRGGSIGSQGYHWFSAQITIDPIAHEIFYQIDDSFTLSEKQKKEAHEIIGNALADEANEYPNPFPSKDGWTINKDKSKITGHATQTDGYSCGYRALRYLLSNPKICGTNLKAKRYATLPLDSESLVTRLFRDQLEDLSIDTKDFESLNKKSQKLFSEPSDKDSKENVVNLEKLESFLKKEERTKRTLPTTVIQEGNFFETKQTRRAITSKPTQLMFVFKEINNIETLRDVVRYSIIRYCSYNDGIWFSMFHRHGNAGVQRSKDFQEKINKIINLNAAKKVLIDYLVDEKNGNTYPHSFRTILLHQLMNANYNVSLISVSQNYHEHVEILRAQMSLVEYPLLPGYSLSL